MDGNELERRELRSVCVHEAAHETIVGAFGGQGQARVWRNASAGALAGEERAWAGQFLLYVEPGAFHWTLAQRDLYGMEPTVPPNWRVLAGLAGLVGECMEEGELTPAGVVARVLGQINRGGASETDLALMGDRWSNRDVGKVMRLLRRRWEQLQKRAAELQSVALDECPLTSGPSLARTLAVLSCPKAPSFRSTTHAREIAALRAGLGCLGDV